MSSSTAPAVAATFAACCRKYPQDVAFTNYNCSRPPPFLTTHHHHHHHHPFLLRAAAAANDDDSNSNSRNVRSVELADKIVDGINFGELCNDFECFSSPQVEATARQLARDILELREGNRALGTFALTVKYKDPVRSFTGRDKYKRPLWVTATLQNPTATVQEMVMLSTSLLSIKWTIRGRPKNVVAAIAGDLVIKVNSQFTLNQISGQVIEHEERWDVSASSAIAQTFFWTSRRLYATAEKGKDLADFINNLSARFPNEKENTEIYPDPMGDPTKFFQRDDGYQRDAYQIALFLALIYFVVQFLKLTL